MFICIETFIHTIDMNIYKSENVRKSGNIRKSENNPYSWTLSIVSI